MNGIQENISYIVRRIEEACKIAGRNPNDIQVLLATKTVQPERIIEAFSYGYTLIGENKVQELKEKAAALRPVPHTAHFIGHLQSNKIQDVVQYAACIQSIDTLRLAEKLEKHLAEKQLCKDILIQVNTSEESAKSGCKPQEAETLVRTIAALPHLHIRGLMTIGTFTDDPEETRRCFRCLKRLQTQIIAQQIPGVSMEVLSMGMSGDLEIAIEEGSTMIRVGSAVFGTRV